MAHLPGRRGLGPADMARAPWSVTFVDLTCCPTPGQRPRCDDLESVLLTDSGGCPPPLAALDLTVVEHDDEATAPPAGRPPGAGCVSLRRVEIGPVSRDGRTQASWGRRRLLHASATRTGGVGNHRREFTDNATGFAHSVPTGGPGR